MDLKYNLEGKYEKLTGGVFVKEDDLTKSAVFRVYVDGVLKYVSPKVTSGQMYSFNVNVSDGQELVLKVEDQNHDLETKSSCVWVAPYIYEGKGSLDESEIYQNLALNKPAEASSSVGETTPQMANDGTDTTIWRGEEVHEGENANPQEWIVDLEDQYNVRNAKIGLSMIVFHILMKSTHLLTKRIGKSKLQIQRVLRRVMCLMNLQLKMCVM